MLLRCLDGYFLKKMLQKKYEECHLVCSMVSPPQPPRWEDVGEHCYWLLGWKEEKDVSVKGPTIGVVCFLL